MTNPLGLLLILMKNWFGLLPPSCVKFRANSYNI